MDKPVHVGEKYGCRRKSSTIHTPYCCAGNCRLQSHFAENVTFVDFFLTFYQYQAACLCDLRTHSLLSPQCILYILILCYTMMQTSFIQWAKVIVKRSFGFRLDWPTFETVLIKIMWWWGVFFFKLLSVSILLCQPVCYLALQKHECTFV